MEIRSGARAVLSLVTMGLATDASAQTATAGVRAEVASPLQLAESAKSLISNSPGVFTLRIPGAGQASTITITAQTLDSSSGAIDFLASSEGADALRDLLAHSASSSAAAGSGGIYQLSSNAAAGTMGEQGVQMILMSSELNGDGSGVIIALITFD